MANLLIGNMVEIKEKVSEDYSVMIIQNAFSVLVIYLHDSV